MEGSEIDTALACSWMLIIFASSIGPALLPYYKNIICPGGIGKGASESSFEYIISTLGAGVLFGTLFLHLIKEVIEELSRLQGQHEGIETSMTYIVAGFIAVLLIELAVVSLVSQDDMETFGHSHGVNVTDVPMDIDALNAFGSSEESCTLRDNKTTPQSSSKTRTKKRSGIHAYILVFSISIHAIFEGMALSLKCTTFNSSLNLGLSLVFHKVAIGLTMGYQIYDSDISQLRQKGLLLFWSLISPFGSLIGIYAGQELGEEYRAYLNGFAAGTFLYVLFMEIMPHVFACAHGVSETKQRKITKHCLVVAGVLIVFAINRVFPCSHGNGGIDPLYGDIDEKLDVAIKNYQDCIEKRDKLDASHGHSHPEERCEENILRKELCFRDVKDPYLTSKYRENDLLLGENQIMAQYCVNDANFDEHQNVWKEDSDMYRCVLSKMPNTTKVCQDILAPAEVLEDPGLYSYDNEYDM